MNWTGTATTPCIWIDSASAAPKRRQASIVGTGRHWPKTRAARAMKPRPALMLRVKREVGIREPSNLGAAWLRRLRPPDSREELIRLRTNQRKRLLEDSIRRFNGCC